MRLACGAIALALAAPGCRPAAAPVTARPEPVRGEVVQYQPLAMRGDARRADQAVILGSDDAGGSTVLALPVAAGFVVVDAIASRTGAAELQPIVLTRGSRAPDAPAPDGGLVVHGGDAGAAAARWRADAWSAALVAATALGKDVGDLALEATPGGSIDATASALVAGGFVALLAGDAGAPAATPRPGSATRRACRSRDRPPARTSIWCSSPTRTAPRRSRSPACTMPRSS
ncbi:MAG: hypothetical protein E6J90_24280 [Deltaproteobacteria bacterium]|nr:MAG: hypothetical protein E6J90_24280 [Deltaproteobacteria bacterium]